MSDSEGRDAREEGAVMGIDWESQIDLDRAGNDIAPPDHDWLAHEAGYPDDEYDAIEADLLADEAPDV